VSKITVLSLYDRVSVFHSLVPFLFSRYRGAFHFTDSPAYCLSRDANQVLFMVRRFLKPDRVDLELMSRLRQKYQTILFFNGNAGGGIPRLEVLPYVDRFYNKALLKDRSLYSRDLFGGELYSDYYHRRYGVADTSWTPRAAVQDPEQLGKLRVSWNVGLGDFPRGKWRQRAGVLAARAIGPRASRPFFARAEGRPNEPRLDGNVRASASNEQRLAGIPLARGHVNARLGTEQRPSIAFHRKLVLDRIRDRPEFFTGRVSQRQFNRELQRAAVTLSPFGWGEVCLRDFEAVRYGSLLLKPDMSHLETWPDVYVPQETYVPFDWDAETLVDAALHYLEDHDERARIVAQAKDRYLEQVRHTETRLESVFEDAGVEV
jgi:hypothetical protein